jgi:long-chain acyl-CoA synthetase
MRAAQEGGEKVAVVLGDRHVTYAQLQRSIIEVAHGLYHSGVRKTDRVAIIHRNAPEFIISYFALARLGAIAVPINFMVQKSEELAYMLKDCGAVSAITQTEFLPGLTKAAEQCPTLQTLWVSDFQSAKNPPPNVRSLTELMHSPFPAPVNSSVIDEDIAVILYTSGTTGFPKGVMLSHRNLVTNCEHSIKRITLTRQDVSLCILPMFHSFAWTALVLTALRLTLKLVLSPNVAPAKPWLKAMGQHKVTLFAAVPQIYAALTKEARDWKTRAFLRY